LRQWELHTRGLVHKAALPGRAATCVSFSPDGSIAAASDTNDVRLLHTDDGTTTGSAIRGHTKPIVAIAFSPDGRLIATAIRVHPRDGPDPQGSGPSRVSGQPALLNLTLLVSLAVT